MNRRLFQCIKLFSAKEGRGELVKAIAFDQKKNIYFFD
jgi:hypothetical protein